jgi:hypothetical protein
MIQSTPYRSFDGHPYHHQLEFNKNWKTKSIVLFKNFIASHSPPLQPCVAFNFQILPIQFKSFVLAGSLLVAIFGPFE